MVEQETKRADEICVGEWFELHPKLMWKTKRLEPADVPGWHKVWVARSEIEEMMQEWGSGPLFERAKELLEGGGAC